MVFIVSDQRIATENFEKGKIYKVVFLEESIFYGVCIGIGSNFVMLSGNISGYLFPLTMETASQVESIDLYTPVEPEPPVPPMTNLLQYQTGVPPFTFNTSGTNLWSYYIKGNTIQNGTPTPTNPVDVVGVGELETTGEHSGQYKIPISSADTTTPVYLGAVQTTRKVKKLVLTGEENITQHSVQNDIVGVRIPTPSSVLGASIVICSHCEGVLWPVYNGYRRYGIVASNPSSGNAIVYMSAPDSEHNTLSTFVQWIKDQYTAGTPVCVWYVLATEETAAVNEPLQKIGDYADSLTSEQAGIQIPTIVGDNTISVDTTVQPSEMQIVYKIADR